jgi:hypothetical protein
MILVRANVDHIGDQDCCKFAGLAHRTFGAATLIQMPASVCLFDGRLPMRAFLPYRISTGRAASGRFDLFVTPQRMAANCAFLPLRRDRRRAGIRPKLTRLQSPTRIPAAALRVCEAPDFLGEEREGGGFLLPPACPNAVHMGADVEPYCATDTDSDRGARSRRSARGPQPRRSFSLVREDSRSPQRFLTVRWWAHKGSNLGPAD